MRCQKKANIVKLHILFFNAAYQLICCVFLFIKAKTKFFNMNGYHQPNLSTNDSIHILKYTSCTCPVVTQFAELHVNVVCL